MVTAQFSLWSPTGMATTGNCSFLHVGPHCGQSR
jgi:hypothetical protein